MLLAWRYICYHKMKTLILIACIFLTIILPVAINIIIRQFDRQILARADSTPAVIGARGSDLDLTLGTIYFKHNNAGTIPFSETETVEQFGIAIPVYSRFTASGYPVVATTLDYYDFRRMQIERGNMLTMLGDCVLGQKTAETLGLNPGDRLLSDAEATLDIGGITPIKMRVTGIFAATGTADDNAVFVDLKTAWVIEGLGHGHQSLEDETDEGMVLSRTEDGIVASAAVRPYLEINETNIDSFHFHGDPGGFPVGGIIALTTDPKNERLLEGRFHGEGATAQFARPGKVVRELMSLVFKVKSVFDANSILIALSTGMLLLLVILLSLKLRQREMQTMFQLGASRSTTALLQIWEMGFIFLISGLLVAGATWLLLQYSGDFVQRLLLG